MQHRYLLEPYKGMNTRHTCPQCKAKGKFVFYIDTETNEHLAPHIGRCERIDQCGYHRTPKQYFDANGIIQAQPIYSTPKVNQSKPTSFIDADIFKASLRSYDQNNFYKYLAAQYGKDLADKAANLYQLGTSKKFNGACVFWQVDLNGNVRTGKIIGFNELTGKRIKQPFNQITWAHKALKLSDFGLSQCLYGLHLLTDKTKTIGIVESEKTAIIASIYIPQFTWLGTSGKTQFTKAKCESLKGFKVVLYPDLGGFTEWQKIAKQYGFACSDLLERKATQADRESGLDLADYLIKQPPKNQLPRLLIELQKEYKELEQAGKIEEQHHDSVRKLWKNAIESIKNEHAGLEEVLQELINYKKLIINQISN